MLSGFFLKELTSFCENNMFFITSLIVMCVIVFIY